MPRCWGCYFPRKVQSLAFPALNDWRMKGPSMRTSLPFRKSSSSSVYGDSFCQVLSVRNSTCFCCQFQQLIDHSLLDSELLPHFREASTRPKAALNLPFRSFVWSYLSRTALLALLHLSACGHCSSCKRWSCAAFHPLPSQWLQAQKKKKPFNCTSCRTFAWPEVARPPDLWRNPSPKLLSLSTSMSWQDAWSSVSTDSFRIAAFLSSCGMAALLKNCASFNVPNQSTSTLNTSERQISALELWGPDAAFWVRWLLTTPVSFCSLG